MHDKTTYPTIIFFNWWYLEKPFSLAVCTYLCYTFEAVRVNIWGLGKFCFALVMTLAIFGGSKNMNKRAGFFCVVFFLLFISFKFLLILKFMASIQQPWEVYIIVNRHKLYETQMLYDLFELNRTIWILFLNFLKYYEALFCSLVFCVIKRELVACHKKLCVYYCVNKG